MSAGRPLSRAGRPVAHRLLVAVFLLLALTSASGDLPQPTAACFAALDSVNSVVMPAKGTSASASSASADAAYDARIAMLSALQEADDEWWDGVEVNVPWAAVGKAYAGRKDLWLGTITDAIEADDPLDSAYTLEDPEIDDEPVVVNGLQLLGLEGFGNDDVRIQCAEFDAEAAKPAAAANRRPQQPALSRTPACYFGPNVQKGRRRNVLFGWGPMHVATCSLGFLCISLKCEPWRTSPWPRWPVSRRPTMSESRKVD